MDRLAFITDLHIDTGVDKTRGIDTRRRFEKVLQDALASKVDMIILGGDLCNREGDELTYRWIKSRLDQVSLPYLVIPGNHDDSQMISDIFYEEEDHEEEIYFLSDEMGFNIVLLDTGQGSMSEDQWDWLEEICILYDDLLIMMHHPPARMHSRHMEPRYAFQEMAEWDKFWQVQICRSTVFCGHYHMEGSIVTPNRQAIYITPSVYVQIDPNHKEAILDHSRYGYRIIQQSIKGMQTYVKWLTD
jgi:3',5'-cyclic-AMP phosphodiesterase